MYEQNTIDESRIVQEVPNFEKIKARFNPNNKIGYRTIIKFKSAAHMVLSVSKNNEKNNEKNTDTNQNFDPKMIEFGLDIQNKIETSRNETKFEIIAIMFKTKIEDLENLDYQEVEQLWQIIEEKRSDLVSFLKLS